MSGAADLDRIIVAWLRDGEAGAPARLGPEIRRAVEATAPRRRGLPVIWRWTSGNGPRALAPIILVCGAVALALLALLLSSGPPFRQAPVIAPSISPTPSASPTKRPSPTPPASQTPPIAVETDEPQPTYPPARSWSLGNLALELPPGWSEPPASRTLAIMAALDQIGDPYAGVYNLILHRSTSDGPSAFAFHIPAHETLSVDAGIRVWTSGTQGATAGSEADRVAALLESGGYATTRATVRLSTGKAVQLDWDVEHNGPDLHYRGYFLGVGESVFRIDFATIGEPGKDLASEFVEILGSIRAEPASG